MECAIFIERYEPDIVDYGVDVLGIEKCPGGYIDYVYGDIHDLMERFPNTYMIGMPEDRDPIVTDNIEGKLISLQKYNEEDIVVWVK